MKKYVSPTSYNASNGGVRGAIPAILGMVAGAFALGAATAAGEAVVRASKAATKKMGIVPNDNFLKISNNLKIE